MNEAFLFVSLSWNEFSDLRWPWFMWKKQCYCYNSHTLTGHCFDFPREWHHAQSMGEIVDSVLRVRICEWCTLHQNTHSNNIASKFRWSALITGFYCYFGIFIRRNTCVACSRLLTIVKLKCVVYVLLCLFRGQNKTNTTEMSAFIFVFAFALIAIFAIKMVIR